MRLRLPIMGRGLGPGGRFLSLLLPNTNFTLKTMNAREPTKQEESSTKELTPMVNVSVVVVVVW